MLTSLQRVCATTMRRLPSTSVLAIGLALLTAPAVFAQTYTVTDLGVLPGDNLSAAQGISTFGDVTGYSAPSPVIFHGFLYTDGKLSNVGTLGDQFTEGYAVANVLKDEWRGRHDLKPEDWNNKDHSEVWVTGASSTTAESATHAFIYKNGQSHDLGLLPGGTASYGFAINRRGEVAGTADDESGLIQAVYFKDANIVAITKTGGLAYGINDRGDIVGTATFSVGNSSVFLYKDGNLIDIGDLPNVNGGTGRAINNSGEITGDSGFLGGYGFAFLYRNGKMISLGTLPTGYSSTGYAINSDGVVVGTSNILVENPPGESPGGTYISHAFLYAKGQMQDLNDKIPSNSGWVLEGANGINDAGDIAGVGTIDGETHAFLLRLKGKRP